MGDVPRLRRRACCRRCFHCSLALARLARPGRRTVRLPPLPAPLLLCVLRRASALRRDGDTRTGERPSRGARRLRAAWTRTSTLSD